MMTMNMTHDIRFYDTCALLQGGESIFERNQQFLVSSITFKELENIKTSSNKDLDIKYSARALLRLFEQYPQKYIMVFHSPEYENWITANDLEVTSDTKILSDAIAYDKLVRPDEVIFVTNDLCLK